MNHILREGAASAQYGWVMGLITVMFLVAFVGWNVWAWSPGRREAMDRASAMPFDDGE